jgi:two-component system, OmpR family, phosphate regulon sensor histidine kinase PhoR
MVKFRAPANVHLRRAQLILLLVAVVPTALMTATGIVLLALGGSRAVAIVAGVLVLAFCTSALTGYVLGSIFLRRGASLARVQNDFLSSVSHELRTPITSMRMFIETLRDERVTDPAERRECLTLLQREMGRLERLVTRLIDLSRIESGGHSFKREPVALAEVVDDAIVGLKAATLGQEVDVIVDVAPDLLVVGDREALAQAVVNLLVNAHKYSSADDPIALAARGEGKQVELSVTDQGPGIPWSEQEQIFEKFSRGRAAVEGGRDGSGLGLSIVAAIARAHRGSVVLKSDSKAGTCFTLVLPRLTRNQKVPT